MRHAKKKVTLDRKKAPRVALLKELITKAIIYEKLVTTLAKAKAVKPLIEKMITLGKKPTLANRRRAIQIIGSKKAVKKIFEVWGPRFETRAGGYTRLIRLTPRQGDGAPEALIEFVD
ncbi:MAG: 50S ribosomal protein L17 [Candidatus Komeilibacteria bacterium]|nr:50S ribosomal protein L17 [Candidatus Komeilibacteria bacterium]